MSDMKEIEARALTHAEARAKLAELVTTLQEGIDALKKDALPPIRRAVQKAINTHEALIQLVADNPQLFVRPRSVRIHGLRVGIQASTGVIEFDDADRVVKLIKKHLPDQTDTLINIKETPVKAALMQLSADQLKKLGCSVLGGSDGAYAKPTETDVDKLVDALIGKEKVESE